MRPQTAVYVQSRYAKPAYKAESYDTRAWPGLELVCHTLRAAGIEVDYCSPATVRETAGAAMTASNLAQRRLRLGVGSPAVTRRGRTRVTSDGLFLSLRSIRCPRLDQAPPYCFRPYSLIFL